MTENSIRLQTASFSVNVLRIEKVEIKRFVLEPVDILHDCRDRKCLQVLEDFRCSIHFYFYKVLKNDFQTLRSLPHDCSMEVFGSSRCVSKQICAFLCNKSFLKLSVITFRKIFFFKKSIQ